jgi:Invasion protein B, involved in pathogenesis
MLIKSLSSLSIAAVLAVAAPTAWAQEATGTEEPAAGAESDLDLGQDVNAEPELGSSYIAETFGDWSVQCVRTETPENDPCQLYQLLEDENGNAVSEVRVFPVANGGQAVAGANVIVPLETLLTQQLTIAVDDAQAKRYAFSFCNQVGCVARIGFTEADLASFRRGAVARTSIVPAAAPDQRVTLTMSLSGFTAGYERVQEIMAAQAAE